MARGMTPSVPQKVKWILWMGAQWSELPRRYGPGGTAHDRLQRWTREGTL
ncbi:MAG: transposase [Thermodesulfobacteriota bacterium]